MRQQLITRALTAVTLFVCIQATAQKDTFITGSFSPIREQVQLNLVFRYDSMEVGGMDSEVAYINQRMKEYEAAHPGKKMEWLAEWKEFKQAGEEVFAETVNNRLTKKHMMTVANGLKNAEYTLLIRFTSFDIGSSEGIVAARGLAAIDVELSRSSDPDNPVGTFSTYGMAESISARERFIGIYQNAAYRVGKVLIKAYRR